MSSRIYISGKMTGLPDFNYPKFNKVAKQLRRMGYTVYNPAEMISDPSFTWSDYMREAIKMMLECDTVYLLDGFETSKGAIIEINLAKNLGMTIVTESGKILHEFEYFF